MKELIVIVIAMCLLNKWIHYTINHSVLVFVMYITDFCFWIDPKSIWVIQSFQDSSKDNAFFKNKH